MRKLISSILIAAFTLPLMAQEVEVKEKDGKTEVTIKKQHDKRDWKRGDRRMMEQRKKMAKKHKIRQVVRMAVIGGIAYYIGYLHGEKNNKGGWDRKPPMRPGEGK